MEKLIVIERTNHKGYESVESIIKDFVCDNYYEMTDEEKKKQLSLKAAANTMVSRTEVKETYDKDAFIIKDEVTYLLSLAKFNRILLLERMDANILCRGLDKTGYSENYVVVNKFADQLIKEHIGKDIEVEDGLFKHDRE